MTHYVGGCLNIPFEDVQKIHPGWYKIATNEDIKNSLNTALTETEFITVIWTFIRGRV